MPDIEETEEAAEQESAAEESAAEESAAEESAAEESAAEESAAEESAAEESAAEVPAAEQSAAEHVDELDLYAEVVAEQQESKPEDDDWWPLARKGLAALLVVAGLIWWFGTDTTEAREARAAWVLDCYSGSPRDICEDVSDDFHEVCYYDRAFGQSWRHRFDKVHAVVTGNRQKQILYRGIPEYIDFIYVECLDERLQEAKKKAK